MASVLAFFGPLDERAGRDKPASPLQTLEATTR
jgi:hypothetical protein